MDKVTFVAATLSLLATPGPTNTLLATSGAGVGPCRSAHLLAAELSGYLLAIVLLRSILGPVIATLPEFGIGLRIAVVIYLIYLAAMLWRHGARQVGDAAPVTFGRVFVTTLLNPKAIIFAFTILPSAIGRAAALACGFGDPDCHSWRRLGSARHFATPWVWRQGRPCDRLQAQRDRARCAGGNDRRAFPRDRLIRSSPPSRRDGDGHARARFGLVRPGRWWARSARNARC
ncbi:LysE family translocator [Bradyrhizobium sp. Leo121]|uniref:LysE family translocator n=1 Tax=Bradyrhizobium sp. Leo121 TaxID=1571195 RepID=UPI001FE0F61A|nr:LysE family translocator [Bradyrhizobium sp. Leo121]